MQEKSEIIRTLILTIDERSRNVKILGFKRHNLNFMWELDRFKEDLIELGNVGDIHIVLDEVDKRLVKLLRNKHVSPKIRSILNLKKED